MTSILKPNQLNQLKPILKSLTQIIVSHEQVSDDDLSTLIWGMGLKTSPDIENELRVWARLLEKVHQTPDAHTQTAVIESLKLRGLHEAEITLAINHVLAGKKLSSQSNLEVSQRYLDLGAIAAGKSAFGEFTVLAGGPGRVIVDDDDRIYVDPSKFGSSPTRIKVKIKPLIGGGVSQNTIKILSDQGDSIDVGVSVDWSNVTVTQPDVTQTRNKPSKPPNLPDPVRQPQIVKEGRMATLPQPVKAPFRFRNGSEASTLEELVKLCVENPSDGVYHLMSGDFEPWLRDIGKTDMASIAEDTRKSSGADFQKLKRFLDHTNIKHNFIPLPDIGWGKYITVGLTEAYFFAWYGCMMGAGLVAYGKGPSVLVAVQLHSLLTDPLFFSRLIVSLFLWMDLNIYRLIASLFPWMDLNIYRLLMAGICGFAYFGLFTINFSRRFMFMLGTIFTLTPASKSRVLYIILLSPIYVLGTWLSVIIAQRADFVFGVLWMGIVNACMGFFDGVIRLFADPDYKVY